FKLFTRHRLTNIDGQQRALTFEKEALERVQVPAPIALFALGGASWPETGSDGQWVNYFGSLGVSLSPFSSMNSGFEIPWSKYFKERVKLSPLKNVVLSFGDKKL